MNATDNLLSKLIELKATLLPPPSEEEVTDAEKALGSKFPNGIRDFYRFCNGVKETTADNYWDFYSLERMVSLTMDFRKQDSLILYGGEILAFKDLVCFCDVAIETDFYHFFGNPESANFGSFYGSIQEDGWLVADSYEKFVQVFLKQHDDLILGLET